MPKRVGKIRNAVGSVLSAPSRARSKARGMKADAKRGRLLWKQGYGNYYESAMSIAKKGKTGQKRGRRR